jgi:hypothetical protein
MSLQKVFLSVLALLRAAGPAVTLRNPRLAYRRAIPLSRIADRAIPLSRIVDRAIPPTRERFSDLSDLSGATYDAEHAVTSGGSDG